jgi:hypothetical protein
MDSDLDLLSVSSPECHFSDNATSWRDSLRVADDTAKGLEDRSQHGP